MHTKALCRLTAARLLIAAPPLLPPRTWRMASSPVDPSAGSANPDGSSEEQSSAH